MITYFFTYEQNNRVDAPDKHIYGVMLTALFGSSSKTIPPNFLFNRVPYCQQWQRPYLHGFPLSIPFRALFFQALRTRVTFQRQIRPLVPCCLSYQQNHFFIKLNKYSNIYIYLNITQYISI